MMTKLQRDEMSRRIVKETIEEMDNKIIDAFLRFAESLRDTMKRLGYLYVDDSEYNEP